jgi:hypothetical protein
MWQDCRLPLRPHVPGVVALVVLGACGGVSRQTDTDAHETGGRGGAAGSAGSAGSVTGAGTGGVRQCDPPVFVDAEVEENVRSASRSAPIESIRLLTLSNPASLEGLECLAGLEDLSVYGPLLEDIGPLRRLTRLRRLYFEGVSVSDLSPLARLVTLESITLVHAPIRDLGPLAELENLVALGVSFTEVDDVTALAGLPKLARVDLSETAVADVAPLAEHSALSSLDVSRTPVSDLAPLHHPPGPGNCQEIWALETPLGAATTLDEIPRLCELGWGIRWSLPGETLEQRCGTICDIRP